MEKPSSEIASAESEEISLLEEPINFISYGKLDLDCAITISSEKKFVYSLFPNDAEPSGQGFRWIAAELTETNPILREYKRSSYKYITAAAMYNEGVAELDKTLSAILGNQHVMRNQGYAPEEHLLIILVDGPDRLIDDSELLTYLSNLGLFSLEAMDSLYERKEESQASDFIYVFESRLVMQDNLIVYDDSRTPTGLDVLFAVKSLNMRKLHSHLWLFYGFCRYFNPVLVCLIDIGTRPIKSALVNLFRFMEKNPSTSGACGEIKVDDLRGWAWTLRAQWFEFKLAHALIKTFEHVCGFIPVLPGAFSIYRWSAMTASNFEVLRGYLRPFTEPDSLTWSDTNIYFLAEDRVLSDKIVKLTAPTVQRKCCSTGHYLSFVKESKAYTEGQPSLSELMWQRKRWNNGAWFALINILLRCRNLMGMLRSGHNGCALILLFIEWVYYTFIIFFQWCAVGAYYLAFSMTLRVLLMQNFLDWLYPDDSELYLAAFDTVQVVYLFSLFAVFCLSLGMEAKSVPNLIWEVFRCFFSVTVAFIIFGVVLFGVLGTFETPNAVFALIIVPAAVATSVLLYFEELWQVLKNAPAYILMIPVYINMLMIFAICRTDDVTWGTRSSVRAPTPVSFQLKKVFYLFLFVISNISFGLIFEA